MNQLGTLLRLNIFGESHGHGVGVVVDGFPPGLAVDEARLQKHLDRRRPGQFETSTPRKEEDRVEIRSGLFQGKSTGAPILLFIANRDVDSSKYEAMKDTPRPGHADLTLRHKYRGFHDYRGGGHSSGRLTAAMVAAGALAHDALESIGIDVMAQTIQIADVVAATDAAFDGRFSNEVRCGDTDAAGRMIQAILAAKSDNDSVGGVIRCRVDGLPIGLGEPIFDSIEGLIARAMLSIPATRGVEFGDGFAAAGMRGSEHNDPYTADDDQVRTLSNHAGGAIGGISNGMPLTFSVAIKPTSSIGKPQQSVDLATGANTELRVEGRHDPCIVPRAVPVVECLTAFVLLDLLLRDRGWPTK